MKPYFETELGKLYNCDCNDHMINLPIAEHVSLILTDPPYLLANGKAATTMHQDSKRGSNKIMRGLNMGNKNWGIMNGGGTHFDPYLCLMGKDTKVILWGANHYADKLPNSTSWLVWDKRCGGKSDDNADCELAWSNLGGPVRMHRQLWRGVIRSGEENISISGAKLHPFQKPVALMLWCLELAKPNGHVLDPYMGSGSTAVACERMGIPWIGYEIEERHCETVRKRLEREQKQLKLFEPERHVEPVQESLF